MEKPNAVTVAWYTDAVPTDPRAVKGQMFGHPCAFVNGNMFFGTFAQSLVIRVGEARAAALAAQPPYTIFEPMEGRLWKEYLRVELGAIPDNTLAALAREALDHTAGLPGKVKKPPGKKAAGAKKG